MGNRGDRLNLADTVAGRLYLEWEERLLRPLPPELWPAPENNHRILVSTESFSAGTNWYQAWRNADPDDSPEVTILYESDPEF